jgi:hypothetical protein
MTSAREIVKRFLLTTCSRDVQQWVDVQDKFRQTEKWDVLSRLMYLDIKTWLPNDILMNRTG